MDAGVLSKKLHAACVTTDAACRRLAESTGQDYRSPQSFIDLKQNLGAPLDVRLLVMAELNAALALLLPAALARTEHA
jgi:hypothetical protein